MFSEIPTASSETTHPKATPYADLEPERSLKFLLPHCDRYSPYTEHS